MKTGIILTILLLTFSYGLVPADAGWRGIAISDVNLRSAPAVGSSVQAVVPRGGRVLVRHCNGTWCSAKWRGRDGWISRRYIATDSSGRRRRYTPHIFEPLYGKPVFNPPFLYRSKPGAAAGLQKPRIYRPHRPATTGPFPDAGKRPRFQHRHHIDGRR